MPELSNQDWLDFLGTPRKKVVDPYLALGKAGLENPTPDLLSTLASPPTHPGGPLTQADLDFLPPRQEPRTALQSPTPPLPPPPPPLQALATPSRSSQAPWEPAPQDVAPEVDGESAPPPLTGTNAVDWNEVDRNNASLANPAMPVQGTQVSNPMLLDDIEARAARQKSGQNASVVLQPDEDSLPMEQGPKPASPVMAQTVEPKGYDPINLLQEQYRDAIRATASARQHDLSEQEMQKYLMLASSGAQHAGGNAGAAAALGQEAAKLQAAPLQMQSLQKQAEVQSLQSKAHLEMQLMDGDSPIAQHMQVSLANSPVGKRQAEHFMQQDPSLSPAQAKAKVLDLYAGVSPQAMANSIKYQIDSQNISESKARETNTYATSELTRKTTEKMAQDIQKEGIILKALGNAASPESKMFRAIARKAAPEAYDALGDRAEEMSGLALGTELQLLQPIFGLMEHQIRRQKEVDDKRTIIPGRREFKTVRYGDANSPYSYESLPAGADPETERRIALNIEQSYLEAAALKQDVDNFKLTVPGNFNIGKGSKLLYARLKSLNAALIAVGSEYGRKEIEPLLNLAQTGNLTVSKLFPGGNVSVVDHAIMELDRAARQRAQGQIAVDVLKGKPQGPAIGFEGSQEGVGPATMVNFRTSPTSPWKPGVRQELNGQYHYWSSEGEHMSIDPKKEDPKSFEQPMKKGK